MDAIQVFNDELQSLLDVKPPVSKAKMGLITRAAMKGVKFYKHIVQSVEKFIAKCKPEYKVPGLYVIDSIVRQSRHQFGAERDVYASRFSRNLNMTFNNLFSGCLEDDKPRMVRVLNLWQKNGVFNAQVIQPLLDMANPNSTLTLPSESTLSSDSPGNLNFELNKQGQTSKFMAHPQNYNSGSRAGSQHAKNTPSSAKHRDSEGVLRFSKNMLDFDYDEDDDDGDETPTEAEPPLSSTLNKIEMEQRSRNDLSACSNQPSHPHQQPNLTHSGRNDQDPVLERWNRLIRQQSITGENVNEQPISDNVKHQQRSRSRSNSPPIQREKQVPKESKAPKAPEESKKPTGLPDNSAEKSAERRRKCLPPIKDKHLTVCSSTLWLGHVPRTVSEADISDAFGEYGTITSIDLIPPRGCAYVCMDRRQDAKRALKESRNLKLNGSHIKMAWAPGKGFKEYKKLKDFWDADIGSSYIPYVKIDSSIDFEVLEEGGVIDEDSMSMGMRETRERRVKEKEDIAKGIQPGGLNLPMPALPILTQPPPFTIPSHHLGIPPPTALGSGVGLGGIPFPPPNVSGNPMQPPQPHPPGIYDIQELKDRDKDAQTNRSPSSIDLQLSMTERQINMVEQQLSMIQQAQKIGPTQSAVPTIHPQTLFQNQPNPLLFDMPPPSMLLPSHHMIDTLQAQQIPIFANPSQLLGQPHIMPGAQPGSDPSMNGNSMPPFGGRY